MLQTAFAGKSISFSCNTSTANNQSILWLYSQDQKHIYTIYTSDKYGISADYTLSILNLSIVDDAYYVCGYASSINSFTTLAAYSLFVKSKSTHF